jgi:hypothetical protein
MGHVITFNEESRWIHLNPHVLMTATQLLDAYAEKLGPNSMAFSSWI